MSTCWKCEKQLPEGQLECEGGCRESAHADQISREMSVDRIAALALVMHLKDMGAAGCMIPVTVAGEKFQVIVRRV